MKKYIALLMLIFALIAGCEDLERRTGIKTGQASEVGYNQAKVGASITDLSENNHQQYGFCYGTNPNPTADNTVIDLGTPGVLGDYSAQLNQLNPNTEYYFRAFVKESDTYIYGDAVSFSTASAPLPTMEIDEATSVTHNSAILTGKIISGNGDSVLVSGICFGLEMNPTKDNFTSANKTGLRIFTDTLTELQSSTKYYARVYGTNGIGTGYSRQIEFTTADFLKPTVVTDSVSQILDVQAVLYGTLTSIGQGPVSEQGFCVGTNPDPTVDDKTVNITPEVGSYQAMVNGLIANTQYFYRAFAKNEGGITYGNVKNFLTKNPARLATIYLQDPQVMNFSLIRCYGQVSDDGGGVTEIGLAWSELNYQPTINDNYQIADTIYVTYTYYDNVPFARINFENYLYNLKPNTRYYIRAAAKNSAGVAYSSVVNFTTPAQSLPEVSTFSLQQLMATKALIVSKELPLISNVPDVIYGVCWNTTGNPDISNQKKVSSVFSVKYFETSISGLIPNTTYYAKAYATYKGITVYGSELTFTTLNQNEVVKDYDGNEYTTVTIGSQVWLQQDLKARHYADGTALSEFTMYGSKPEMAEIYGLLYKQDVAVRNIHTENTQGACPNGWNIPSEGDWETLISHLGGYGNEPATQLKESGDIHWNYDNTGTNSSGFTAIGAGIYRNDAILIPLRKSSYYWTSTPNTAYTEIYDNNKAFGIDAGFGSMSFGTIDPGDGVKNTAVSVRCIKSQK